MSTSDPGSDEPVLRRDRREHGGASTHRDDEALARRTEQERVEAGVDDYDPNEVPPATDVDAVVDPAEDEENEEAAGVLRRQQAEGEIYPLTDKHPFPPTHYDE
jgi:hypothetical protein